MKTFLCTDSQSLKDFTDCHYPQGSFCFSRLLRDREIKVNGARVSGNIVLSAGDSVAYYTTPKEESAPSHRVVFEDENIYVADKFSGVTSEGLSAELNTGGQFYPVHRLDRNTAGLIVYAKNPSAEAALLKAFREGGVEKTYYAVCLDNFKRDAAVLKGYLVKDPVSATVKIYGSPVRGGLKTVTEYSVSVRKNGLCIVRIILRTGRTHQIRAQFAGIGCPILGDEKYGDGGLNKKYGARRQRLLAAGITFSGFSGGFAYLNGFSAASGEKIFIPDPVKEE